MRPGRWISYWVGVIVSAWAMIASAEEFLPSTHQKVRTTQQVYDQLTRSISDPRTPPEFRIVKGKAATFDVAQFLPSRHAIYLEEQFYDVLQSAIPKSERQALAFILGHELAHFYRSHRWAEGFGRAFAQRQQESNDRRVEQPSNPYESGDERRRLETEADYFAGFYSHLAGFDTLSIAPQVFDTIYSHYRFNPSLPGYEHLRYRKETTREAQQRLRELLPLFDTGIQALLIHDYASAGRIFDRVATEFPSPEVLNNSGVADVLAALEWYPEDTDGQGHYVYPLELDPDSRLAGEQRGTEPFSQEEQAERRRGLLQRAKKSFERAAGLNPSYVTAVINLTCVLDLLGDFEAARAKSVAVQSFDQATPMSLAHAHTMTGIALAHLGQKESAQREFELAVKMGDRMAGQNLARLLSAERSSHVEAAGSHVSSPPEQVAGVKITDVGEDDFLNGKETRTLGRWDAIDDMSPGLMIMTKQHGAVRATAIIRGTGSARTTAFILNAKRGAEGHTGKGIRRGQTAATVQQAYGLPTSTFISGRSHYHVYQNAYRDNQIGIIFQFDESQILEEWMVFRTDH